jgi:TRAP-type transport system large permease protein
MLLVMIVFTILLIINMPIAFTIGISSSMFILNEPTIPLSLAVQRLVVGTQAFPLLAVPFFVLAGHIMNASGITSRLLKFADALTGHIIGSIGHVSIVLAMMMGGISGSSNADAGMQTRMMLPKMREKGYEDGFSACILAFGSLVVAIIPPGIGLILFGFVGQVSVGKLFIAGIIPGIMMGLTMMVITYIIAKKNGYDSKNLRKMKSLKEIFISFKESFWALLFPVVMVLTIRFGIFTPTEAGAFAVVYAAIIGIFAYKELTWKKIREAIKNTVEDNAMIMLIVSMASILGYILVYGQMPQYFTSLILGVSSQPYIIMAIIIIFLLVAGCFMEGTVNILVLTPIFLPIIIQAGFDPVHFGILMCVLVQVGGVTPPVGVNMFVVCSLGKIPIETFVKASVPFFIATLILIIVLVIFPGLSTFLPNLLM